MSENEQESRGDEPMRKSLENEYTAVANDCLSFLGWAFALLAFAVTFTTTLVGAYQYVIPTPDKVGGLRFVAFLGLPFLGITASFLSNLIVERLFFLYDMDVLRGIEIEARLGIAGGHFQMMRQAYWFLGIVSIPRVVRVVYLAVYLTWLSLMFASTFAK